MVIATKQAFFASVRRRKRVGRKYCLVEDGWGSLSTRRASDCSDGITPIELSTSGASDMRKGKKLVTLAPDIEPFDQ